MENSELHILVICSNRKINQNIITYFQQRKINIEDAKFDYVDTTKIQINKRIFETTQNEYGRFMAIIGKNTCYFYDFVIYQKCLNSNIETKQFLKSRLLPSMKKNLKNSGRLIYTTEKSYFPSFLLKECSFEGTFVGNNIIEFRKNWLSLLKVEQLKYKILIICFSNNVNQKLLHYLQENGINLINFDYIGFQKSELNGEQIVSIDGTASKEIIEKVKNLSYSYDFIFYEFCPIEKESAHDKIFSQYSISVFKQKLKISGKIVFLTGKRKYKIIIENFKPYHFVFHILNDRIIELSHQSDESVKILDKVRQISKQGKLE